MIKICFSIISMSILMSVSGYSDTSRYPYGDFRHCGETLCVVESTLSDSSKSCINTQIDPTFSTSAKNTVSASMSIFLNHALNTQVIDCAYENSHKDLPTTREYFEGQLKEVLKPRTLQNLRYPGLIYIGRVWNQANAVGVGYTHIFYNTENPSPGYSDKHYCHIALNSDFLGSESNYQHATDSSYWAGVIAHEVLHNLGYIHPTGYEGSFIKEYGRCLTNIALGLDSEDGTSPDYSFEDLVIHPDR